MKVFRSILTVSLSLFVYQASAQNHLITAPPVQFQIQKTTPIQTRSADTVNCTSDTLQYVRYGKATNFIGITMNVPSEFAGYSQYYDAPQQINVSGLTFYAGVNSTNVADTAIVKCRVFTANPDSSVGMVLTEKDIVIYNTYFPSNIDVMKYTLTFDSIAVCNQAYFVSVYTETTQPLGIITDDYNANDGQGEELGYWYWTGDSTWYKSGEFFTWDVDWLIEPIVDYTLINEINLSVDSICAPDVTCAVHSRSPIFENRMYNQQALAGTPELSDGFDWGDGNTTTGNDSCHTYTSMGQYLVSYTATMTGWTSNCDVISIDTLTVGTTPTAGFTYSNTVLTADFTNTSAGSLSSVLWDFGDGNTSTLLNPSHTYANAGTYTVCLIVSNYCSADTICQTVVVTCPNPVAGFTFATTSMTADFTDVSTGNNIIGWAWDFGDGNTATSQSPSYTYTEDGNYNVCVEITDDCGVNTYCDSLTINTVGISPLQMANDLILVYPNPSNGNINVSFDLDAIKDFNLEITEASGRIVYRNIIMCTPNNQYPLNFEGLTNGIYYMNFTFDNQQIVKQLIISKEK